MRVRTFHARAAARSCCSRRAQVGSLAPGRTRRRGPRLRDRADRAPHTARQARARIRALAAAAGSCCGARAPTEPRARRAGRATVPFALSRARLAGRSTAPPPVASTMSSALDVARPALPLRGRGSRPRPRSRISSGWKRRAVLEFGVGIDEALVEAPRELAAECRLARTRQADQKQIAPVQLHRGIVMGIA